MMLFFISFYVWSYVYIYFIFTKYNNDEHAKNAKHHTIAIRLGVWHFLFSNGEALYGSGTGLEHVWSVRTPRDLHGVPCLVDPHRIRIPIRKKSYRMWWFFVLFYMDLVFLLKRNTHIKIHEKKLVLFKCKI